LHVHEYAAVQRTGERAVFNYPQLATQRHISEIFPAVLDYGQPNSQQQTIKYSEVQVEFVNLDHLKIK